MNILVTRPLPEAVELVQLLNNIGYFAVSMPLVEFVPGKDLIFFDKKINNLKYGDFIFFLSKNAVYFSQNIVIKKKLKWPNNVNYYAIGSKTSLIINLFTGFLIKYPKQENSEFLFKMIDSLQNISGKNALILCGNKSSNILSNLLIKKGLNVDFCECYKSIDKIYNGIYEAKRLIRLGINTLIVTSGEILKRLYYLFPKHYRNIWLLNCTLVVISKRLFTAAKKLGWNKVYISEKADNISILKVFKNIS